MECCTAACGSVANVANHPEPSQAHASNACFRYKSATISRRFCLAVSPRRLIPETFPNGLVKKFEKHLSVLLRTEDAIRNVEKKVNSGKYRKLWPKAVLEALSDAITRNEWESALKIFGLLRTQCWYIPNNQTYSKMIVMLGRCGKPDRANLLFNSILVEGLNPTVDICTALVKAYGSCGLLDRAFQSVDDMQSLYGCKPNIFTYSILSQCCANFQRSDLVNRVLGRMSREGVHPTTITYNMIIDGYGKNCSYEEMERLLDDDGRRFIPDTCTMNSVISAFGNDMQIEKMEEYYEKFHAMGVASDTTTFNTLVCTYGRAGMHWKMLSVLDYMVRRFYAPSVVTYTAVIDAFGRLRNVSKMEEYFERMKGKAIQPTCVTYVVLIRGFSLAGRIDKIDSLMTQVWRSKAPVDTAFFNAAIGSYARAAQLDKMKELFTRMERENCSPDHLTFSTMRRAFEAHGMLEDAREMVIQSRAAVRA